MNGKIRLLSLLLLAALVVVTLGALRARPAIAASQVATTSDLSITSVSGLNASTNEWTITLSTGSTLRVENRVFDTGGSAPQIGAIADFDDQGWFPILGYYGYATFTQHAIRYHAKH